MVRGQASGLNTSIGPHLTILDMRDYHEGLRVKHLWCLIDVAFLLHVPNPTPYLFIYVM